MIRNLRFLFISLVFFGLLISCSSPEKPTSQTADAPSQQGSGSSNLNTLSAAEAAEGWTLLFDGTNLDRWRGFKNDTVPPGWGIENGLLFFNAEHGEEGYGDLTTKETFSDFDLALEWKTDPCGNSGVLFRVSEDSDQEWHTGPEAQIVDATEGCWSDYRAADSERVPGTDLKATQLSGANYDLQPPAVDTVRPVGEWNQMRVLVRGPHVEHWLNGEKVVEYELWSEEWKRSVSESKFNEFPKYGLNKSGHIVLQDHGKSLWFRNIKIRTL